MGNLDILVLTPAGVVDPALAIAAYRAGAQGFLDLEYEVDSPAVRTALDRLVRFTPDGFGVKLGPSAASLLPRLLDPASHCREVLLAGGEHPALAEWIALLRSRQIRVLFEAVTISEALCGAERDIDGLVLKGHESGGRVGDNTSFILLQRWQAAVNSGSVRNLLVYAQGGINLDTVAAFISAGAAGVVLDSQLLLTRESLLSEGGRASLPAVDAHAKPLADRYRTVGGIVQALRQQVIPAEARSEPGERPSDIAIIGMACFLPGASDVRSYWENVVARVNAITEVPPDHWDWRLYYDANPKARDKICSKWGGFLADMPFDPLTFGMPPNSLSSIEPVQLYALEAVRRALADAGYADRPFNRERTAVILGAGGGAAQLAISYSFRSYLPMLATVPGLKQSAEEILRQAETLLPEWTEDSFPGILINVIAGRVANRFNFGGPNYSIDAACGSSLAALHAGVRELEMGTSDVAVVMGADTVQNPYTYMAFSKTHAFSARGRCGTFDEAADGIVISEGVAAVILKRLS